MKSWIIAIGLGALAAAAWAEGPGPAGGERSGPPKFEEIDANGDGSVSLGEFTEAQQKQIEKRFRFLDTNHDGQLSQGELESGRERMQKRFQQDRE